MSSYFRVFITYISNKIVIFIKRKKKSKKTTKEQRISQREFLRKSLENPDINVIYNILKQNEEICLLNDIEYVKKFKVYLFLLHKIY